MGAPFNYHLPPQRIAQRPVHPYDSAKLLIVDRAQGTLEERTFADLPQVLSSRDLLVFNDTKVLAARFPAKLEGAEAELLLVSEEAEGRWRCIGKPMRRFLPGTCLVIAEDLRATIVARLEEHQQVVVQFEAREGHSRKEVMERRGIMPIPPYIRQGVSDEEDRTDYQTLFAQRAGSIAAPTASLHFTPALMEKLSAKGVDHKLLTLHVGLGSIRALSHNEGPVTPPGAERFHISDAAAESLENAKARSARIIAVGTTVTRTLETFAHSGGRSREGSTDLFIQAPFEFNMVDALITNFHQPGTSHLLLVEAFMGRKLLEESYRYALEKDFRFLSYGDGMLII